MKKVLFLILALVLVIAMFAACAKEAVEVQDEGSVEEQVEEPMEKFTIGISYQGPNNDWAINFKAHFEMTLDKYSDQIEKVIYKECGWEETQQIADVEDLMTIGIDILIIAPMTDTGLATSVENVKDAGIPVVVYNSAPGTEKYDALLMSDKTADGSIEIKWMCERLDGEGDILIMSGAPGSVYAEDLLKGYEQTLAEYPGINVLGYEYAYWTPATAKEIVESYIAKGDEIDGIVVSGLMGLGCLEAFTDAGLDIPPMTSGDGWTGFLRKAIEIGYTDFGAIPTNSYVYAVGAIEAAFDILNGNPVEKVTLVPTNDPIDAQEMLDMVTDDMPASYWIGATVPKEDFEEYANR